MGRGSRLVGGIQMKRRIGSQESANELMHRIVAMATVGLFK
jgi:hypothetical protein